MRFLVAALVPLLAAAFLSPGGGRRAGVSQAASPNSLVEELRRGYRGEIVLQQELVPVLDRERLLSPFRRDDCLATVEGIMTAGFALALSRLDVPIDPERLRRTPPRFAKPLPMSKLRRALRRDPSYFSH